MNSELLVRKANRLRDYDYSQDGAYFIQRVILLACKSKIAMPSRGFPLLQFVLRIKKKYSEQFWKMKMRAIL